MKKNESVLDRVVRIVLGIVFIGIYLAGVVSGSMGIVLVILGAILLVTGIVGFCPLYAILKFRTDKK